MGHFSFPKELQYLQNVMASVASETYSCVSTPIQYAGITAYEDESIDDYLFHCRRVLETVGQYCASTLIDAGIKVRMPVGAFYIFPDFQPFEEILNERNIFKGVAYLGSRPTFGGKQIFLEINIFGIKKNLYKKRLRVYFLKFIRADRKFSSPKRLVIQMNKDVILAKKSLKTKLIL